MFAEEEVEFVTHACRTFGLSKLIEISVNVTLLAYSDGRVQAVRINSLC